jgi:phage pi2 protein 07
MEVFEVVANRLWTLLRKLGWYEMVLNILHLAFAMKSCGWVYFINKDFFKDIYTINYDELLEFLNKDFQPDLYWLSLRFKRLISILW